MADEEKLRDYLKRVTADLHRTRERLRAAEEREREPIAIVSMACRYPGAVASPDDLWRLVAAGTDAITAFPRDRGWDADGLYDPDPERPGKMYVREGGFLDDAPGFDAGLFGISPREAAAIDPQQRLLLELAWELFESARIPADSLRGSATGVFAGVIAQEYAPPLQEAPEEYGGHLLTGNTLSVASGRVAYSFGLEGPAVTVDTACSSSLVAIHLAEQALRSGECSLAIAGGATVFASAGIFVEFSRQRGLAPDGRCKPFGAGADGTNFAEGGGLLLLERLSDAQRNGHPVLAVIRASAVNQDGASNGLTAPNGPAQQRVIHQALSNAGLTPDQIDVVEAHGTGTRLGDPIEAQALQAAYATRDRPLYLGSIKSNLGHTQAAAGVAGVIKTVMALSHDLLPATLHADEPTPHVDWSDGPVALLHEPVRWPQGDRPRRAAVSSFGISGTNAHLIVEEAPAGAPASDETGSPDGTTSADDTVSAHDNVTAQDTDSAHDDVLPWVLSAATPAALRAQARRLLDHLGTSAAEDASGSDFPDFPDFPDFARIGLSLATTRTPLEHRAAIVAHDRSSATELLAALAEDREAAGLLRGIAPGTGRTAFLFTGQGSQRPGMGRELYAAYPQFAAALDAVCAEFDRLLDTPLRDLMFAEAGTAQAALLDQTAYTQCALFAYETALYRLLESLGVRPDYLMGHSIGEICAAHAAGVLTLSDACALVAARGRLMQALPQGGAMAAIEATEAEVRAELAGYEHAVDLAALNGPRSTVVSGDEEAVERIAAAWRDRGRRAKRLRVSHAFHSPHMDPMLEAFREVARSLRFAAPRIPLVSNVTGELATAEQVQSADYWTEHVRRAVRFTDGVAALRRAGVTAFVEVGPDTALTPHAQDRLSEPDGLGEGPTLCVAVSRAGRPESHHLVTALAALFTHGVDPDWSAVFAGRAASTVQLPTYAFQHERFWIERRGSGDPVSFGLAAGGHPLLGAAISLAGEGGVVLTGRIAAHAPGWLADHAVAGSVLVPGTALIDLAVHAGDRAGCGEVEELVLQAPLVLGDSPRHIQVTVGGADETGRRSVRIHSRPQDAAEAEAWGEPESWICHALGTLAPQREGAEPSAAAWIPGGELPADCAIVDVSDLYPQLAERGYEYGPAFRLVERAWRQGTDLCAEVGLPEGTDTSGYGIHPALLDATLHALALDTLTSHDPATGAAPAPRLPFAWTGVRLHATGATQVRARLRILGEGEVAVTLTDPAGALVAEIDSLTLRAASAATDAAASSAADGLFHLDWTPIATPDAAADPAAQHTDDPALDPSLELLPLADPDAPLAQVLAETLAAVRERLADEAFTDKRIVVQTRGAVAALPGEEVASLAGAAVWGLIRSAQSEYPGRIVLLDLDPRGTSWEAMRAALAAGEPQLALRGTRLYAPRLARLPAPGRFVPPAGQSAWRLDVTEAGTLENLALLPAPEALEPLAPGQVRVAIRAVGLNFRDVLLALGMYPGSAAIGSEGAGIVLETAPDVTDLAPGDRVMGLIPGSAGPIAASDRRLLARVPSGWSFAQAAAAPIVYLTAYYGLVDLGGLRRGDSVLIHSAAGGVGMAAGRLARHLGLKAYGTASAPKWGTLLDEGLPAARIASSRDLAFEEAFRAQTGGRGFDAVLNSLAGDFVDASARLLAPGGRLLEMGKTDIRDPQEMAERYPGTTYRAFDLMDDAGADRVQQMLLLLGELFDDGTLAPPPVTAWDIRQAPEAFRYLSQAKHTGKVVLTVPAPVDPEGTALVTGGTGNLGKLFARHLVTAHGVRRLVLAGRRGTAAEGVPELVGELTALGADVTVEACDTADRTALAQLLDRIPREHPLTAVVHAAGVLDDAPFAELTDERIAAVLRPKAEAAIALHDLTTDADLSMFVLFSSIAGVAGNAGQGGYAAANAHLDALALRRRRSGLPATSLAWGPWSAVGGMTAALSDAAAARIGRTGLIALDPAEGTALFDAAIADGRAVLVPTRLDQRTLAARADSGALPPLLRGLIRTPSRRAAASGTAGAAGLTARLAALPAAEQDRLLLDLVRGQAAIVLGHSAPEAIEADRAFNALGLDSLTAVELRNRINDATGLRLPATVLFDYPNAAALAALLRTSLLGADAAAHVAGTSTSTASVLNNEPIAIIGMSCRFPGGVRSPEQLWELVAQGVDAIGPFPRNRGWDVEGLYDPDPDRAGKTYAVQGGFLYDADEFDADFFGLSPREAIAADPQQRLLLETSWEAFERAGIDPTGLGGSRTGVFAGVIAQDYASRVRNAPAEVEGFLSTGNTTSVASGRIAYTFGLEGPAVTVDTACSSSLVALHLACQSLRLDECSTALVAGATVMAGPATFVEFSRQRGLAADGRIKAFSAAADGTGWGEGVGVLLLERLSDARRNGHRVLALVRASAVNQDGASNGLTAPNGPSQQRVIRQALAGGGITPADVDAVEAHGTGTSLGDPIEAQALLAVYGAERSADRPLWLGSVKSNIGHTLAAAGVAGVIKTVMALRNEQLPRTLHVDEPTPHVDWSSGAVRLLTEQVDWPRNGHARRAGVSSFGISGTNAHVVIEEAPEAEAETTDPAETAAPGTSDAPVAWIVSARDEAALRAQAAAVAQLAQSRPDLDPRDVGHALATSRAALEHRAVAVGADRDALIASLHAASLGQDSPELVTGTALDSARTVFVFPGQGSQWTGMALELFDSSPAFRDKLTACAEALARYTDWSLLDVLRGAPGAPGFERVDVVQPALFAVMVSLAAQWQAHGVRPDAVVGHSQGEIAAAHVAGVLSLDDAARVVALRSRALLALAGTGGMASVPASAEQTVSLITQWGDALHVAAVNGPASTVVAGTADAVDELVALGAVEGVRIRKIPVDYASHSPHVEAIRDELARVLEPIRPTDATVPFYSAVTGGPLAGTELDAAYWYTNLREQVRFEETVGRLLERGHRVFVECSPHPVLVYGLQETIEERGFAEGRSRAVAIESLKRDDGGAGRFLLSLARAHAHGVAADWSTVFGTPRAMVDLPTYPFQRRRYWLEGRQEAGDADGLGLERTGHGLVGALVEDVESAQFLLTGRISLDSHPWLRDHAVAGTALLPGTAFVELATHAAGYAGAGGIEELTLETPLVLPEESAVRLRVAVGAPDDAGRRSIAVYSRPADADGPASWTRHALGTLTAGENADGVADADATAHTAAPTSWPAPGAEPIDVTELYDDLADIGLDYGPAFRGVRAAWRLGEQFLAEVALPEAESGRASEFAMHPALLDSALHTLALARMQQFADAASAAGAERTVPLPYVWSGVSVTQRAARTLRVRIVPTGAETVTLHASDEEGRPVAAVSELTIRPVPIERLGLKRSATAECLFVPAWTRLPSGAAEPVSTLDDMVVVDCDKLAAKADLPSGDDDGLAARTRALTDRVMQSAVAWIELTDSDQSAESTDHADAGTDSDTGSGAGQSGKRMVVVTRGAVSTGPGDPVRDPAAAAVWGLIRTAQSENPGRFVLVDLDESPASDAALAAAVASDEPQLAIRDGEPYALRLRRAEAPGGDKAGHGASDDDTSHTDRPWNPDGTVLITGGTGTLGRLLAEHLVAERGVRHLLLTSRQGTAAPGATELLDRLRELGAEAEIAACDAADAPSLDALLAAIPADRPLTAIVHTAGVLDDGLLGSLTSERLDAVLRPKVDGAWNLHRATRDLDLAAFVLFSSFAALTGNAGQAAYAAANGFLDALAEHRRSAGLPGVSLAWGLWEASSAMTGGLGETERTRLARTGLLPLTERLGLELFDAALGLGRAVVAPVRIDAAALRARSRAGLLPPLLRELVPAREAAGAGGDPRELARRLAATPEGDRERLLLGLVRGIAAGVLGHADPAQVRTDRTFAELGFDSLTALQLRNALTAATGLRLPATMIFDYPTLAAVTGYLHAELAPSGADPAAALDLLDGFGRDLAQLLAAQDGQDGQGSELRRTVATRLRRLLDEVTDSGADGGEPAAVRDLESASAAEILAFIDNELGRATS